MELLRILSLVYAGVLVLALAASLIAIWIILRRIAGALADARDALIQVEERTGPLEELLQPFAQQLERSGRALQEAEARFSSAGDRLADLTDAVAGGALAQSTTVED